MDKIEKTLKRLTPKEREIIKGILVKIKNQQFNNLDLKKLKGRNDIFRARKGNVRIIYRIDKTGNIFVLSIERRNDTTYNF
ncbi:MAG: type II toxin-antitoxin system RelE/ParE family toxin [Candidatus Nealsonbacteria bacterium]